MKHWELQSAEVRITQTRTRLWLDIEWSNRSFFTFKSLLRFLRRQSKDGKWTKINHVAREDGIDKRTPLYVLSPTGLWTPAGVPTDQALDLATGKHFYAKIT